ncbi:uncharacterized protein [Palaemon carinicauda]|uniref:uncharacterized protein n=1 Tax=Palaemon carinicauda TaxID=392227 RepID=UPI0035B64FA6
MLFLFLVRFFKKVIKLAFSMSSHSSVNDDYDFVDLVYDDIQKFLANPHGERSPASSRRESESSSPCDTLAKNSPERMPVTVPSASEQGNNRRRAKAPAQIYRPPPARSSKEPAQQSQQPMQPHQPLYSQPYQPKPNFSHAAYLSQHNPHQQDFHPYNMIPNRQRTDSESSTATTSGDYLKDKGKGRRPDQVLYIPRGRRHAPDPSSARGTPTPVLDYESNGRPPSPAYSVCSIASEYSGRNRYNKPGSRQGSQISICEGETDRLHGKPPLSRDFSRESTPGYGRQKNPTLFSSQTLQLIERCLNQDADQRYNEYSNGESDALHSSPSPKNKLGGGRALKSPTPTRDIHSIHSKENVIHPVDPSPRSRRSRKNRRRNSRSRDTSVEQLKDGQGKGRANHNGEQNSPGERGMGSCERIFYNSNFNSSQDRYDRGYDNYDRYSSINSSRASSRNSSRERTPQYSPQHNWRVGSNPPSPTKGPAAYYQNRQSPGKPPSGRLGSLPNVALDFGESPRRVSNYNEENQRYHTLPIKSKTPVRSNSLQTEDTSSCIMSERINTNADSVEAGVDLIHQNEKSLENLKDEMTKNLINASSNSAHNESLNHEVSRNREIRQCPENEPGEKMEEDVAVDSSVSKGLQSESAEDSKVDVQKETKDDVMNKSVDAITSGTASEEDAYEMEAEASLTESAKDSTEEVTSSDNDTRDGLLESITEVNDGERNIKKFQFNWADEVEDSWDSLYDDNGECLNSDIKRQLSDSLGKIKLEKPANDYYSFQPKEIEINDEEYGHVIEIYDFPVAFKTQDLMMVFSSFHNTGFDIKWVDDTHALGIFASALIAAEALSIDHPFLKTRSLATATKSSKAKALRITEALLPYKPRPATSASLARRLVSGALGLKVNISREVREAEKQKLKDAKARKRLAAKQRADAWEGTLS